MALNGSGPISLAGSVVGESIAVELGESATGTISLNDAIVRNLAEVASGAITMPTNFYGKSNILAIGDAYEGGFFAGQISTTANGVATHNLVIGPLSTAENASIQWKNARTLTSGADSDIDGPQNTADMVADGSSTVYPAAHFCNNLSLGGFSDWYMPAKNEFEVCYFNLKPTTSSNNDNFGINPNAVPARASNYTSGNPAQTSAAAFQSGGAEAFAVISGLYWSSTIWSATKALFQTFTSGNQGAFNKDYSGRVRAVRRLTV